MSYAIRELGCKSGVVLTASHKPKEYNGYSKVYWDDGGQVIAPHDKNIIAEVNAIGGVEDVKFDANESRIEAIGKALDDSYIEAILDLELSPEVIERQSDLGIVFFPIHGTSITLVPETLARKGFKNVTIVEEQATPDGNFPTEVYPNPGGKRSHDNGIE